MPVPECGCWIWMRSARGGYGTIWSGKRNRIASRASWIAFHDEIPEGLVVCHRCDVTLCVNPDHLFLGTRAKNTADSIRKDRFRPGFAKLAGAEVLDILTSDADRFALAEKYDVTESTVRHARTGRTWSSPALFHILRDEEPCVPARATLPYQTSKRETDEGRYHGNSRKGLPIARVQQLLSYEPDTGLFRWRISRQGKGALIPAGSLAGISDKGKKKIWIDGRFYAAHHLAWLLVHGNWPNQLIGHFNGDGTDNRITNLRALTHGQKQATCVRMPGRSGARGVQWSPTHKRWVARIGGNKNKTYLGHFGTLEAAAAAYRVAAIAMYGELARVE